MVLTNILPQFKKKKLKNLERQGYSAKTYKFPKIPRRLFYFF